MFNLQSYWQEFYKREEAPSQPSEFAKTILKKDADCFELGGGNGRDSYYLGNVFNKVVAFDYATTNKDKGNVAFVNADLETILKKDCAKVVYSRFFLHCLANEQIIAILDWTKEYFFAEFRIKGDNPVIYKHERNLVDLPWLVDLLLKKNFEFTLKVGRGLAKYKEEDPLVARVYAKKI